MRLPDWDDKKTAHFNDLWEKLRKSKRFEVHEAVAHLLSTQPDNPIPKGLILHLTGSANRRRHYRSFDIPKKRGGSRQLTVPSKTMKWVQRGLLQVLTHLFPRHRCAVGFERNQNPLTHAQHHARKRLVYVVDLEDFFPSITWKRVFGMFQAYPFKLPVHAAQVLANLATFEGVLPQGAPSSPIIANLLCRKLDSRLFKWARQHGYQYSRYADDLAFSTNKDNLSEEDQAFIDRIISEEGFSVNPEKRRLMPSYRRQLVTGLVVNEKPNLPHTYRRSLRALLHNVARHGWQSQVDRGRLFNDSDAWVSYRDRNLDREDFEELQRKQQHGHLLIRPTSRIPHAQDVSMLQQVVRGRIAYFGLIRGEDCPIYQRLLHQFNVLVEREARLERGRELYDRTHKAEPPPIRASDVKNPYAMYKELEDLTEAEYRERLGQLGKRTIEYQFLLRKPFDFKRLKQEARKVANSELTTPEETAQFFREFDNDQTFRGLLHEPIAPEHSNGAELVGACEEALSRYKLPNRLRDRTEEVLQDCRTWLAANKDGFPWQDDELRDRLLIPYKKLTRFDLEPELGFRSHLEELADNLSRRHEKKIEFDANLVLRTYTPDVINAIKIILTVMMQHTESPIIHVVVPESIGKNAVEIRIFDDNSVMKCVPELASGVLKGECGRAVSLLRGYASWKIVAPFSNGTSQQFDVMTNSVEPIPSVNGVTHIISFPDQL